MGGTQFHPNVPGDSSPTLARGHLCQEKPDLLVTQPLTLTWEMSWLRCHPQRLASNVPVRGGRGSSRSGRAGLWGKFPEIPNFIHSFFPPFLDLQTREHLASS